MDMNEAFDSALRCHQEGKIEQAEIAYRRILESNPNHLQALHYLGVLNCQSGNYDLAIEFIEKAIKENKVDSDMHYNLGVAYQGKGELDLAFDCYQRSLSLNSNNSDANMNMGIVRHKQGRLDEAIVCYQKALEIDPRLAHACRNLGAVFHEKACFDRAIDYYKQALRLAPNDYEALINLGSIFQEQGQYEEAIVFYQKALLLKPDLADVYCNLGFIYYEKGDSNIAADSFHKALALDPNNADIYNGLGVLASEKGDIDKAITYYQKALELNSGLVEAYNNLGVAYCEKKNIDKAIACYRRALEIKPDDSWTYTNLCFTLQREGRYDEAAACLQRSLELIPHLHTAGNKFEGVIQDKGPLPELVHSAKPQQTSILIIVPAFNRKKITQLSLMQLRRYKTPHCHILVYNDHSTEYDNAFLGSFAEEVILLPSKMGIDSLRLYQLRKFLESDFKFLYMTDNDALHDPHYITILGILYELGNCLLPVSLFNSLFHLRPRNILYHKNGILLKKTAPGISMFLDKKMVEKIVSAFDRDLFPHIPAWDYRTVACLGLPWMTPETSYLEHFGADGITNRDFEKDRAINPTPYLLERRNAIIQYLTGHDELSVKF